MRSLESGVRGLESVCDVVFFFGGGAGGLASGKGICHTPSSSGPGQEAGLPPIPGLTLLPRTGDHFVLRREELPELLSTPGWVHGAKH